MSSSKKLQKLTQLGISGLSFGIAFLFFMPLIFVFLSIFNSDTKTFQHIIDMFLFDYSVTTILLIAAVVFFSCLITIPIVVLMTLYDFPAKNIFQFLFILPLTIPSYIGAFSYDKIFDYSGVLNAFFRNTFGIPHLLNFDLFSFWGGAFIFTLFFYPYLYTSLFSFFRKNIGEMVEVSRSLGYSTFKTIFKLILPYTKIPIITGSLMIVMEVINDFGVTSYLGLQTFSAGIFKAWFSMNDFPTASKLAGYLIPTMFIVLFLINKFTSKQVHHFSSKQASLIKLHGLKSALAVFWCSFIFFLSYLLPTLLLLYYSFFSIQEYPIAQTLTSVMNTLILTSLAMVILLILGVFFVRLNTQKIYSEWFALQYALPSIIIAVAILSMFFQLEQWQILAQGSVVNLQSMFLLLIFAYIMRFLILGYNISLGAFKKIGTQFREVSRTFGYSAWKTFFKLELPLVFSGLKMGAVIIFIDLFKELPLTLFLRPFNFETPSTRTYDLVINEMFVEATPSALAIIFILGLISYHLFRLGYFINKPKGSSHEN